ncbi:MULTISPECIES: EVE domain-containing protein [Nostocales]|uniref:UPF0310 protein DA73_0225755 n=3 Tax=Nostocales TaxID=1161 RepID=A0A0C1NAL2_9CYAN|nr:EVE domain-containing protein [Tolypothrix bouteillei]KAF3884549.1 EVE domain-containing protein [Tolypothrix bouteillei VB521301]
MNKTRYWIGVGSKDRVIKGVEGGFCQLCHGKANPLKRLAVGDWIIYYSPHSEMGSTDVVQAFTAIGQILEQEPYLCDMGNGFVPYRRDVRFIAAEEALIRPLLDDLSFTKNKKSWGYIFRLGLFEICLTDFRRIATAMNASGCTL